MSLVPFCLPVDRTSTEAEDRIKPRSYFVLLPVLVIAKGLPIFKGPGNELFFALKTAYWLGPGEHLRPTSGLVLPQHLTETQHVKGMAVFWRSQKKEFRP
jgi:hypothetical protein